MINIGRFNKQLAIIDFCIVIQIFINKMGEISKKIRITEGQLRMIELLEDSSSLVDTFRDKTRRMEDVVDGIWNKVTFMGVNDIIDQIDQLNDYIEDMIRLDDAASTLLAEKERVLDDNDFTDEMSEFDVYVDGLVSDVKRKTRLLTNIISHLLEVGKIIKSTGGIFPQPTEVG